MSASSNRAGKAPSLEEAASPPGPRILGTADYAVLVTARGTGFSWTRGVLLTAWAGDPVEDRDGFLLFLRDVDGGTSCLVPAARECLEGITTRLEVGVAANEAAEVRRVTLENGSRRRRTIEVTSRIEVALADPAAFAAHPSFSKLFVQTEGVTAARALLATRRPRESGEHHPTMIHAVDGAESYQAETDRAKFERRGDRGIVPWAAAAGVPLSGSCGDVLDPLLAIRLTITLEPGARASCAFLLGAARDREGALAMTALLAGTRQEGELAGGFVNDDRGAAGAVRAMAAPFLEESSARAPAYARPRHVTPALGAALAAPPLAVAAPAPREALRFFNGYGGFTAAGDEYVLRFVRDASGALVLPPRPWVNVVANERFGFLASETGAGTTWCENSREHRITPWANDPLLDPHGEAFFVRDDESGALWSPLPGPAPGPGEYETRHGFGESVYLYEDGTLEHRTSMAIAGEDPVKVTTVRIRNRGDRARTLSIAAFARLVLGADPRDAVAHVVTEPGPAPGSIFAASTARGDIAGRVAFCAVVAISQDTPTAGVSFTADRRTFVGRGRSLAAPLALESGAPLDGRTGAGLDPCFAQRAALRLAPGAAVRIDFLLGEGGSREEAAALLARYSDSGAIDAALAGARSAWTERLTAVRIETPSPALDLLVNGWLPYQVVSCRLNARTALYQSGGAFGFRDQLQDAASLAIVDPALARRQLLLHAAHQFVEGDVLHWWHPPKSRGIRTRFADDLLWLPYLAAHYAAATGDEGVFDEVVPFLDAPLLSPGEDERFLLPRDSGTSATLWEHCLRAIDRSAARGASGLPLFGTGDWNDGMNRVGREGRGESVWMGFFLVAIADAFIPLCERRGDGARAQRLRRDRDALVASLNGVAWDGAWYRRGTYDDGTPLGSSSSDECRIDALAQSWSVLSGVATPERAAQAMGEVDRQLVSESDGIIRLLAPPFRDTPHDPGYIKGYVAGVRENGGQYTHAALWVVSAFAKLGRRDRVARLLDLLNPIHHSRTPDEVARYQVEPYVIAADVYGEPPHVGRGGWTWYTGSAGWMFRVALESLLGVRLEGGRTLVVKPCVPDEWRGFTVTIRMPGDRSTVTVRATNPNRSAKEVVSVEVAGAGGDDPAGGAPPRSRAAIHDGAARIPLPRDGRPVNVTLVLGDPRRTEEAGRPGAPSPE